jgi:putative ABC transport system permease protein
VADGGERRVKHIFFLVFRYLAYYRLRTVILLMCLSITFFLPLAVHVLVEVYNRAMIHRAEQVPLLIGPLGSPRDLVLAALYFKGRPESQLKMAQVVAVRDSGLAAIVPLYLRYTAGGRRIVGTTLDYFSFHKLRLSKGALPQILGDAVLGAAVARDLGLRAGDRLLSDQEKVYDISSSYPLLMRVTGVLEETGTADDMVVFTDIHTVWIIEGIGHGHADARSLSDPTLVAGMSDQNVSLSAAVAQYQEITPESLTSFHFHGNPDEFPLTAILAFPYDAKSATILKNRYREGAAQAVVPAQVVAEIMDIVFRVKRFFEANFALVLASSALFLVLVMTLSLRLRQREFLTLYKMGCSRGRVVALQAVEVALLLTVSGAIAAALTAVLVQYVIHSNLLL